MSALHSILEIRTGRDAEHTPETAAQIFATLPQLQDRIWHLILRQDEHMSFELIVENQTIYFTLYCPNRLLEYMTSVIQSSYPEALIQKVEYDFFRTFVEPTLLPPHLAEQPRFLGMANLALKNADHFPLKTYQDFSEVDPLSPILSTLSKAQETDRIGIQYVVKQASDRWKNRGLGLLQGGSSESAGAESATKASRNKLLIEKKLATKGLQSAIRIVVSSQSQERADLLLETIATAFQSMSQSEGNALRLKKTFFFKQDFLQQLAKRSLDRSPRQHLNVDELATLFHWPNEKLASIPNIAWGKTLLGEPPEDLPIITKDMPAETKRDINAFAKAYYKNEPRVYGLRRPDRRRHMYVIGKTGTGKSTLLANMAINDLKNDEGLCIIDPHGDLVETLLDYIPSHRINDVVYFDPSDTDRTVQINLFEGENTQHRELIASGIVSVFQKLYSYSWGPRLEYMLRNALLTLLQSPQARMSDIVDLLTNAKFRARVVESLNDEILRNFWLYEFEKMPDRQRTDAIAPILNKVGQFVSSPIVRDVVNAHRSSFSIEQIMNEGKILLVNLSQGKLGEDNATLLGAMLITKIQLAAMGRVYIPEEERRDFYLYVDEFQNFATDSFNKILSEARKYRLNLILANQYIAQIPEEVQKAIFGNCGSMISFVMGAEDAGAFQKEFGDLYSQDDLVSLGRYQIVNKITIDNVISRPFPALTLALAKSSNQNREKVVRVSRERYAKKKAERAKPSELSLEDAVQAERAERQAEDQRKADKRNQSNSNKNYSKDRQNPNYKQNQPKQNAD